MARQVPNEKQKRKLANLMEQLDWFYGVSNQDRYLNYKKQNDPESPDSAADISIDEQYQRMTISIYPNFWDNTEKDQRAFMIHEYTHYLVQPLQRVARNLHSGRLHTEKDINEAVEKVTSSVTIIIDALLSGKRGYMLKAYEDFISNKKTNATNTTKTKKRARAKARV